MADSPCLNENLFEGRRLANSDLEKFHRLFPAKPVIHDELNLRIWRNLDKVELSGAEPLSPSYFADLVSKTTATTSLPHFGAWSDQGEERTTIPLYASGDDGKALTPTASVTGEGIALALRVLPEMLDFHLHTRLHHEMRTMMVEKTTSQEQMERVNSLLYDYAAIKRLRKTIADEVDDIEQRVLHAIVKINAPAPSNTALENLDTDVIDVEEASSRSSSTQSSISIRKKGLMADLRTNLHAFYVWIANKDPMLKISPEAMGQKEKAVYKRRRMEAVERRIGLRNRLLAAVLGGLSLVVPTLVMAVNPSQVKTLVTSSVAVILFSVGLALKSTAKTEVLLGTAAAYAAVMVVFVGVNSK